MVTCLHTSYNLIVALLIYLVYFLYDYEEFGVVLFILGFVVYLFINITTLRQYLNKTN